MNSRINFNELWQKQKIAEPNHNELMLKVSKYKKLNLKRLVITNVLLIATSCFIVFIWLHYKPQLISTKIGIVLTILAMLIYLVAYNQSFTHFKTQSNALSNREFLKELLVIKSKQQFMQTTILNIYFIMLSTGLGLYMYEYTSRMSTLGVILVYGLTSCWILINWFYFRPKQIKKQQSKLNEIINRVETLNNQLMENE